MKSRSLLLTLCFCLYSIVSNSQNLENGNLSSHENVKAIYMTQNEVIVGIQRFDNQGRTIFDRTTQIIEDWDNHLMTWITVNVFEGKKKVYEYYGHSNTGLRVTIYTYNHDGSPKEEYSKFYASPDRGIRNPFTILSKFETENDFVSYLKSTIPDTISYSNHTQPAEKSIAFFKTYLDKEELTTNEYWKEENGNISDLEIEKFNTANQLVYYYSQSEWNETTVQYKYDLEGNLIEELESWDSDEDNFQKKEHSYEKGLLQKTLFYHGKKLAFTYDYSYENGQLKKEVKTRHTETEHFQNRPKVETIVYKYEFFE